MLTLWIAGVREGGTFSGSLMKAGKWLLRGITEGTEVVGPRAMRSSPVLFLRPGQALMRTAEVFSAVPQPPVT